jgi:hypothetical protein
MSAFFGGRRDRCCALWLLHLLLYFVRGRRPGRRIRNPHYQLGKMGGTVVAVALAGVGVQMERMAPPSTGIIAPVM